MGEQRADVDQIETPLRLEPLRIGLGSQRLDAQHSTLELERSRVDLGHPQTLGRDALAQEAGDSAEAATEVEERAQLIEPTVRPARQSLERGSDLLPGNEVAGEGGIPVTAVALDQDLEHVIGRRDASLEPSVSTETLRQQVVDPAVSLLRSEREIERHRPTGYATLSLPATVRLFVAIELPRDLRAEIAHRARQIRAHLPKARWISEDNLHITLCFLGQVETDALEPVTTGIRSLTGELEPIELQVTAVGAFPGRVVRILWLGLEAGPELAALAHGLELELLGREPARPYHAHITLARCRRPWSRRKLEVAAPGFERLSHGSFTARSLVLMRSHLSASGARYEPLEVFPLSGARTRAPGFDHGRVG